ncbi:hypothetical protein BRC86_02770 [Halobacteriales archaeon QS_3_64_16]|nr:MAG: hypothetical protein BRC86_02770 [Halobacteriales archaeon QS_3_64_16]
MSRIARETSIGAITDETGEGFDRRDRELLPLEEPRQESPSKGDHGKLRGGNWGHGARREEDDISLCCHRWGRGP